MYNSGYAEAQQPGRWSGERMDSKLLEMGSDLLVNLGIEWKK